MNPASSSSWDARLARPLMVVVGVATSLATSPALRAQAGTEAVNVELFTGVAWNVPTPLVVRLDGDRRAMRARYSTRPFEDAPYYSYRVGHATVGREIDVEMPHHEVYLENPVPPVARLEVSHGYNMPTVNVGPRASGWRRARRARHRRGPPRRRRWWAPRRSPPQTAAVARVPLEHGTPTVPNAALHALGGVGVIRTW